MNFFRWVTACLVLGLGGQNDVSDQSQDALRVCNVNIRKSLLEQKWGTCL